MGWNTLDDIELAGKIVLVRVDINVPVDAGRVTDATRIKRIVPTINDILAKGGTPVMLAHFGRPKGKVVPEMSLRTLLPALEAEFGKPVTFFERPARADLDALPDGAIALLENTRFTAMEEANDPEFAAFLAALGDVYVNDAFSAAHRAHASTEGVARLLPNAAGRLMQAELEALNAALGAPKHPVVAIVGGAKVSTKLELLANLVSKVDHLVIGGGMANTFLAAQRFEIGTSLAEREMADTARDILARAAQQNCQIILPVDIVVASEFAAHAPHTLHHAQDCPADGMILDAGPATVALITDTLMAAETVVWNGPLGAFELAPFDAATVAAAQAAASLTQDGQLISVAGGGDTVAALNHAGVSGDFSYVSTAGGAFLEWMEGKTLPGVAALDS
jgi:phosphoglycerate kinase